MYWDVVDVRPVAPRELAVTFFDGLHGIICITPSFCTGVFSPLLDDAAVTQAQVQGGVVVWPQGLDLAPDTMYHAIQNNP